MNSIPYYWVNPKNNRAYWKPNPTGRQLGFTCVPLGQAGPEAEKRAQDLTAALREARGGDALALGKRPGLRENDPQYVYFLHVGDRIKIGTSKKPLLRVQEIAAFVAGRLKRVIIVEGTARDERRLHDRFSAYRANGEWFVASRPLILTICRCAAAGSVVHDGEEQNTPRESNLFGSGVKTANEGVS